MSKLQDLRNAILAADAIDADQLFTYLNDGKITDTGSGLRYEATASVTVTDWTGSANPIARAIVQWLRTHENAPRDALEFEVAVISNTMVDIGFRFPFTDVVVFDGSAHADCAGLVPNPDNFFPP